MFRSPRRKEETTKVAENSITGNSWSYLMRTRFADSAYTPPIHAEYLLSSLSVFYAFSLFFSCLIFPSVTNLCLTFSWQRAAILHHITGHLHQMQIHKGGEHKSCSHSKAAHLPLLSEVFWFKFGTETRPVWWCHRLDELRLRSLLRAGFSTVPIYTRDPPHIIL